MKNTNEPADRAESAGGEPAEKQISRRQFGRNAAAAIAAATTLTAPALLATDVAAAEQQTRTSPTPQQRKAEPPKAAPNRPEPLEGLTPEQTAEVDARLANILRKYGTRFTAEQKERLRRILAQNERMMAPVRAFALQNGDPPASVLRISFDEQSK